VKHLEQAISLGTKKSAVGQGLVEIKQLKK